MPVKPASCNNCRRFRKLGFMISWELGAKSWMPIEVGAIHELPLPQCQIDTDENPVKLFKQTSIARSSIRRLLNP
jgi:hypothetical protein